MTNPTWPAGVPSALAFGATTKPMLNQVVFKPSVGPELSRKRSTLTLRQHEVKIHMRDAEAASFLDFYQGTLADGTLPFDGLKDPFGSARTFRIYDQPSLSEQTRGLWQVTLKLEEVPQ